jgi:hypothetical protein
MENKDWETNARWARSFGKLGVSNSLRDAMTEQYVERAPIDDPSILQQRVLPAIRSGVNTL